MVMLGRIKGFDGTGLSQSMNIYWHHAALLYVRPSHLPKPVATDPACFPICYFSHWQRRDDPCDDPLGVCRQPGTACELRNSRKSERAACLNWDAQLLARGPRNEALECGSGAFNFRKFGATPLVALRSNGLGGSSLTPAQKQQGSPLVFRVP